MNLPPKDINDIREDQIYDVPIEEIFADSDFNVRGEIEPLAVNELAKDIKANGLIQPITLQPFEHEGKRFRIIAGHRRHMAHLVGQLTHVRSAIKVGLSDIDAVSLNLKENLHRAELNMLQEALSIKRLKMLGLTETETAGKVGKSRGWVQVRYMILSLPFVVQEEVAKGTLNSEQIRECYSLPLPEDQIEFVRRVKDAKLLKKVKPAKVGARHVKKEVRTPQQIFEMQDTIRDLFGNGFETILLGWAAGATDDWEVHQCIKEEADQRGKYYQIPTAFKVKPLAPAID
jgi:ParB family chromosome partitioning protein